MCLLDVCLNVSIPKSHKMAQNYLSEINVKALWSSPLLDSFVASKKISNEQSFFTHLDAKNDSVVEKKDRTNTRNLCTSTYSTPKKRRNKFLVYVS